MTTHTTYYQRAVPDSDDEIEIEVEFTLTGGCAATMPSLYDPGDPGSPADFEITECIRLDNDEKVTLTDAEHDAVRAEVFDRIGDFEDDGGYEEF